MGFYEEISKYYDYIFPVSDDALNFISKVSGKPPKNILDVACGSGGYAIELAKKEYNITAVDIDHEMINSLSVKMENVNIKIDFLQSDMLDLKEKLKTDNFNTIFCIGNSIVHLNNIEQIKKFLQNAKDMLKKDGSLIIQIINFDRVILKNVKSLPTITNEEQEVVFERFYNYDNILNKISFKTILNVGEEKIENDILLLPIQSGDLIKSLKEIGFNNINMYGDFKYSLYDRENSYALIIEAKI